MSMTDGLTFEENEKLVVPWIVKGVFALRLLTPSDYRELPVGTILGCISGEKRTKSQDSDDPNSPNYIDQDTRAGRLAWGLIEPAQPTEAGEETNV